MPQSLTKLYAHLVFNTKNRHSLIDDAIQSRVHGYVAMIMPISIDAR